MLPVTVCIAALCQGDDGDPRAVVATDRMVTLGNIIEFEHTVPKAALASPFAIAMVAGDSLIGTRIALQVASQTAATQPPIAEISQRLAKGYEASREEQLSEQILRLRGLDLGTYYQAHTSLNPQIVAMLDNQMSQFNLGVELLLAGVDPSGAHIHMVQNPGGTDRLLDIIGYAAIGSGAIHALQSMIGFRHGPDAAYLPTVFRVYASKKRAEVAPGVGLDTDMAVISVHGVHWLTDDERASLDGMYEDFRSSTDAALTEKLSNFSLGEGTPTDQQHEGVEDEQATGA